MTQTRRAAPTLCIVAPCFDEEEVLSESIPAFTGLLKRLSDDGLIDAGSHVLLVDDGSRDRTWAMIEEAAGRQACVQGLKLSRNRGHQNAVLAGLMECEGDLVVSIDADLQDDVDAIEAMVRTHIDEDAEIVFGVRSDRSTDTAFKRLTAEAYYSGLRQLGVDVVFNHADFRLMSRRAIEALRQFGEVNLFLRGMTPMLGFKSSTVEYARGDRAAGRSKYPLHKMLSLAWNGVTSMSIRPLRIIITLGALVSLLAFLGAIVAVYLGVTGQSVAGWASLLCTILFLGGMQLLAIGLIGEYVGKVYLEVKQRPRYIIEKRI